MASAPSLFEVTATPVFSSSADWIAQVITGPVAATLCVVAIAFLGLMLMTGRLAIREAMKVVLGCFVLLGAPAIAESLRGLAAVDDAAPAISELQTVPSIPAPAQLPPANYDPYAGASLKVE